MSVLKSKRTKSSIQYLKTADDIFSYTANFCSRLSPRYTRIFTDATIKMASILVTECGMANAIYPNSEMAFEKRKSHLVEAKAALSSLDIMCGHIYSTLMLNPQGAFRTSSDKLVDGETAIKRLDDLCQTLGEMIDTEDKLLSGIIRNDRERQKKDIAMVKYAEELSNRPAATLD